MTSSDLADASPDLLLPFLRLRYLSTNISLMVLAIIILKQILQSFSLYPRSPSNFLASTCATSRLLLLLGFLLHPYRT